MLQLAQRLALAPAGSAPFFRLSSRPCLRQALQCRAAPATVAPGRSFCASAAMAPIDIYSLATPNGQKVGIIAEELGLEYNAHLIDIGKGDQFTEEFVKINPNSKIPAIVDPDGPDGKPLSIFESGAILLYLAEKHGKLLPADPAKKWEAIQWLFFQVGGIGPMMGQMGHFAIFAKDKCDHPYPKQRYVTEVNRLFAVVDKHLEGKDWIVAGDYSVADIALAPWMNGAKRMSDYVDLKTYPNVKAWLERFNERPAVIKGITVCARPAS